MVPIITLTTDFGVNDAYAASMKGVILSINPQATIIDICHTIEPQNIAQAAFVLSTAYIYFPRETIHIAIVDPGVGSQRKAVILKTSAGCFIAPDNGILSYVIDQMCPLASDRSISEGLVSVEDRELSNQVEAVVITNRNFWCQPVSPTFHGRDIFAPVAAHLSLGVPPTQFGEIISSLLVFSILRPYFKSENVLIGHVIHVDRFGNLITNIRSAALPQKEVTVEIDGQCISGLSNFYTQSEGLMAIIGSTGYLEIALRDGNAQVWLHAHVGDIIKLSWIAGYAGQS